MNILFSYVILAQNQSAESKRNPKGSYFNKKNFNESVLEKNVIKHYKRQTKIVCFFEVFYPEWLSITLICRRNTSIFIDLISKSL